jgi:PEP-CTERM motif/Low-density lipoprotein receptor repeat class B
MTLCRESHRRSGILASSLVVATTLALIPSTRASSIYWSTHDLIQQANADGSGVTTLVSGLANASPLGIAVDPTAGAIYWTTGANGTIDRANLDGSGAGVLVSGLGAPDGIAFDSAGRIYWTDENQGGVHSANADGSNVTTLVSLINSGGGTAGFAIDNATGKMYWGTLGGILGQANLDGSGVSLNSGLGVGAIFALAVNSVADTIYLASGTEIVRLNADGTGETTVVSNLSATVTGLAVDAVAGKIYWTEEAAGVIESANLDGTGITTVLSGLTDPVAIALVSTASVPEPSTLVMSGIGLAVASALSVVKQRRRVRS